MAHEFPYMIKQLCSVCYRDSKYHEFKDDRCVNCDNRNINPVYVNAKDNQDFVRDFRNNGSPENGTNVDLCSHPGILCKYKHAALNRGCSYANSEYEYFVWNWMKTHRKYKISQLFAEFISPFVFTLRSNQFCHSLLKPLIPREYSNWINPVPNSHDENERVQKEEKKKIYFCWFCLRNITSEHDIATHVGGTDHSLYYEADKKRRWYFKMPKSKQVTICEDNQCQCFSPHTEHEYREMNARIKFRNFNFKNFSLEKKDINPWPFNIEIIMPFFPNKIECYNKPVRITVQLILHGWMVNYLCLRDDKSRPFFSLYDNRTNQKGQILKFESYSKIQFENFSFEVEFAPLCSGTYIQTIEFGFVFRGKEYCCQKLIRVDVGTTQHLMEFAAIWSKYEGILKRSQNEKLIKHLSVFSKGFKDLMYEKIVPFAMSDDPGESVLSEALIRRVLRVVPNLEWLGTRVEPWNYCDWMRDMMVHEELEQQLLLSQLLFIGNIKIEDSIVKNTYIHARPRHLFGTIEFKNECHSIFSREFMVKNVNNAFVVFHGSKTTPSLFECQIVDYFRYGVESRSINELTLCFSEHTVSEMDLKHGTVYQNITILFRYNRLVFDRRHKSLNNIAHYDSLSYKPLCCPSFTRLPFGEDQSAVYFKPKLVLNTEQLRLPKLVLRQIKSDEIVLPFILNGAFGTGKSSVIAETVRAILLSPTKNSRVLICTRSYSAGKVYLEMFHNCLEEKWFRQVAMVIPLSQEGIMQAYEDVYKSCLVYNDAISRDVFDINRVFITSLDNVSDAMTSAVTYFDDHNTMFDYLFVDEAAQVLEVDAIMVYQFGNRTSKFIFAGDVFQVRPELYNMALKKFSVPIVCRLHVVYNQCPDYEICLKEVYRSHPGLVRYLSEAIYRQCGLTSAMKPRYPNLSPMKFIDSNKNGNNHEEFDDNFGSYKNEVEAKMVVMAIQTLMVTLKTIECTRDNILVCSPFFSQVKLIQDKLNKKRITASVLMPSAIQGKEFDAVFISTVLTINNEHKHPIHHPTFHSNKNVINLAISRAKHYVEVIGDKQSLLRQQCKFQWEKFIELSSC